MCLVDFEPIFDFVSCEFERILGFARYIDQHVILLKINNPKLYFSNDAMSFFIQF